MAGDNERQMHLKVSIYMMATSTLLLLAFVAFPYSRKKVTLSSLNLLLSTFQMPSIIGIYSDFFHQPKVSFGRYNRRFSFTTKGSAESLAEGIFGRSPEETLRWSWQW